MKTNLVLKSSRNINNVVIFLVVVFLLLFAASKGFTQEAVKHEPNTAMKKVFNELKAEDSSIGSFVMIGGIIAIVGVAMYMSFKGSSSPRPRFKGN